VESELPEEEPDVSASITPEQLEQLHEVAESFDRDVPELTGTLDTEVKRSGKARDEVSAVLAAGGGASTVASVKREYETVDQLQRALLAHTHDAIAQSLGTLTQGVSGGAPGVPPAVQMTPEEAFSKLRAMSLALDEVKLYRALALAVLNVAQASYNDMCEAFLGYEIGSHDARRRFGRWFAKFGTALAGVFVPPVGWVTAGIDVGQETIKQAKANPLHERVSKEKKSAAGEDARVELKDLATSLLTNINWVEENVGGMLLTYAEEYAALKALQAELGGFFES
jgi:hypothetical protein